MVEEQIDMEVLVADLEQRLSSDEGEASAEFEQEALDVLDERLFNFPFAPWVGRTEEVEQSAYQNDRGALSVKGEGRVPSLDPIHP